MNIDFLDNEKLRKDWIKRDPKRMLSLFASQPQLAKKLTLKQFAQIYVYDFDQEAQRKGMKAVQIQDFYEKVWNAKSKSMIKAPREHLKTTSVLLYLLKMLFTRDFPIEINYYHLNIDMAIEKLRVLRKWIQANPILSYSLGMDEAISVKQDLIVLKDGTIIQPLSWNTGVVGKHPHIIVMDDVINKDVIYSDEMNKKAIEKFYMDILPMITKMTDDKKIMCIGTSQRNDDLYASLPQDFYKVTLGAFTDRDETIPLAPDLYTRQDLQLMKDNIISNPMEGGIRFWLKEYMNIPFDKLGNIVKGEDIQYYDELPPKMAKYQGWDLSVGRDLEKSDYTAGCTIGVTYVDNKVRIYVLDIYRARIPFAQRLEMIRTKFKQFMPYSIGIESVSFQYDTIQTLRASSLLPIMEVKAIKNKIESFQTEVAPYFENHQVYVREDMRDFINELLSLPAGSYDDMADAFKIAVKTALFYSVGGVVTQKDKKEQTIMGNVMSKTF